MTFVKWIYEGVTEHWELCNGYGRTQFEWQSKCRDGLLHLINEFRGKGWARRLRDTRRLCSRGECSRASEYLLYMTVSGLKRWVREAEERLCTRRCAWTRDKQRLGWTDKRGELHTDPDSESGHTCQASCPFLGLTSSRLQVSLLLSRSLLPPSY